jgi:hypothetical protein
MQLEMQAEAALRRGVAHEPEEPQQRLRGGHMGRSLILPQPVPAWSGLGQPHTSAHSFYGPKHLSRLPPGSVEQQHLGPTWLIYKFCSEKFCSEACSETCSTGGEWLSLGMEDPQFAVSRKRVR